MKLIETELARIIKPFDAEIIWNALEGRKTLFDIDAAWSAHHHGQPRTVPRGVDAFDGSALLAGVQALAFLSTNLAAGDSRRTALAGLDQRITKRLENDELLLFADIDSQRHAIVGPNYDLPGATSYHSSHGVDTGALVATSRYLYFRPAKLERQTDLDVLENTIYMVWPTSTYGFAGVYSAYKTFGAPGFRRLVSRATETSVADGAYETDPRNSVPETVAHVAKTLELSEDAATLYLQLLSLCDVSDKLIREVNGWKAAQHKKAIAELASRELVSTEKQPRANRTATLPGTWEKLRSPQPGIERWKLALYQARIHEAALWAPLGRILPLRPAGEIFESAWNEVVSKRTPRAAGARAEGARDWIAAIRDAPEDETPRQVYADHLSDLGDARGELIALQLRRRHLARAGDAAELEKVCRAEARILENNESGWIEPVYSFVEDVRWDRGFITSITIHGKEFAKHAEALFEALPLLREVRLLSARRNHIDAFVGCPAFERIRQLDFTPDEYIRDNKDLAALLGGKHLPLLEWLRIGFHRSGGGVGGRGGKLIAACERLRELRFLEVAGQNLGLGGVKAIVKSPHLTRLEVLRVPLNGIKTPGAWQLLELLESGALPALRVLDIGNVVETSFVTKAALWGRNRADEHVQQAIIRTLAERHGQSQRYREDPSLEKPPPPTPILDQDDDFPFAAIAKSSRSRCIVCTNPIDKGTVRIGVQRQHEDAGRITGWLHPACIAQCAELESLADVEERLVRNSSGVWPDSSS